MSVKLLLAIIIITLALIFYTIGVWSEHHAGVLKKWHVIIFYCGLICDTIGTTLMESIARSHSFTLNSILLAIHGISWTSCHFINAIPCRMGNYCNY